MADWHYKIGEEIIGPLDNAELLAKVRAGDVTPETLLQKGDSRWVAAEEVNGLFEAVGQKALEYYCPGCREKIHRPPTHCEVCGEYIERADTQRFQVKPLANSPRPAGTPTAPPPSLWQKFSTAWKRWTE